MAGFLLQRAAATANSSTFTNPAVSLLIAGKPSDDLAPGAFNSILKQASLKEQR
jgi:hypothetical protein